MRSPLKWHGGKSYLAPWIIEHFPSRDEWHLYREPFAGGLSVLFRLEPEGLSEAVNDKLMLLSRFWQVLQDATLFGEFSRMVSCTPFSEVEFSESDPNTMPFADWSKIEAAHALFILARQGRQGMMKEFATPTQRLRRGMNENVSAWLSAVEGLPEIHERLKRVEVRCMDAVEFINRYDNPRALFYCDPPYLYETRSTGGGDYEHEMSDTDHERLLACLSGIKGKFCLSGYRSEMYDTWAKAEGFRRVEKEIDNKASGKKSKPKAVECLWMNY